MVGLYFYMREDLLVVRANNESAVVDPFWVQLFEVDAVVPHLSNMVLNELSNE